MKKGFALDDERLKRLGGGNYFDELLSRIRDIRSSEKVFWRKVLEIYATSIDYNPNAEESILFFKQVQNSIGLLISILPQKLYFSELMPKKKIWDLSPGKENTLKNLTLK